MAAKAILDLKDIRKEYALGKTKVVALKGVDLAVDEGEFTVVTGPSGSGKTTLLNIIGCLDRASGGSYKLDGQEVGDRDFDDLADVRNRKIGFIFQNFNLIPVLNVEENIEFPLAIRRGDVGIADVKTHVRKLAEAVGLSEHLNHKPDELSGGQRQRVAIARALVTKPRLVLADEPTANLDSVTSEQIINLMLELNREQGVTFLFSTHDHRVVRHARRVLSILDGRMVRGEENAAAMISDSHAPRVSKP